jgi:hypothetical protein
LRLSAVFAWLRRYFSTDPRLTRFIFSGNDFSVAKNLVKPRAFMPQPDDTLSVFETEKLRDQGVWAIGADVASERKGNLHARADIPTSLVTVHKLRVVHDEPPRRHRNIVGWPPVDQKEDRKLIAMQLAASATLRVPSP